jgi:hypothetical protein
MAKLKKWIVNGSSIRAKDSKLLWLVIAASAILMACAIGTSQSPTKGPNPPVAPTSK